MYQKVLLIRKRQLSLWYHSRKEKKNVMKKHEIASKMAIALLPNEDQKEISAVINTDGTVDTYTSLSAPEWLHPNSRRLRLLVADVLQEVKTKKQ